MPVNAVETSAMSRQPKQKPIQVISTPVSDVIPAELRKLQQEDATLAQLRKHAEAGTERETEASRDVRGKFEGSSRVVRVTVEQP
ncbi:hypothetical protein CHS0354_026021 [Potamilus streckersoni]|uniref:Uncharacterized protein n=1 Tax=Potamilus streckersoni TaxID=2493646 RepID=A0AAE0VTR6_9BIVA|nr:hypothetical protein CHS0354_026021 [Potamilus streckersoni]